MQVELKGLEARVDELSQRYWGRPCRPEMPGYRSVSSRIRFLANVTLQAARKRASGDGDKGRYAGYPLIGFLLESDIPFSVPYIPVADISDARVKGTSLRVGSRDVPPKTPFVLNAIEFVYFMTLPEIAGMVVNAKDPSRTVRLGASTSFVYRGEHRYPGVSALINAGDPVPPTVLADVEISPGKYRLKDQFHRELGYLRYARLV